MPALREPDRGERRQGPPQGSSAPRAGVTSARPVRRDSEDRAAATDRARRGSPQTTPRGSPQTGRGGTPQPGRGPAPTRGGGPRGAARDVGGERPRRPGQWSSQDDARAASREQRQRRPVERDGRGRAPVERDGRGRG